jgi:hypothetical protein
LVIPCAVFFQFQQHRDAIGQSCCLSCHVPRQGRRQRAPASVPTRPDRTSAQSVDRRYSSDHTLAGASATVHRSGQSRAPLPQSGGILLVLAEIDVRVGAEKRPNSGPWFIGQVYGRHTTSVPARAQMSTEPS